MYIALYFIVIIAVATALVLFFLIKTKKDKQRIENLSKIQQIKFVEEEKKEQTTFHEEKKEITKEEEYTQAELVDYSLDFEDKTINKDLRSGKNLSPFEIEDDEYEDSFDDEEELNNKFLTGYKKFAQREYEFEDEDFSEEDDDIVSKINEQTDNKIDEIMQNLSPEEKEQLVNEILARKSEEE